MPNYVWSAKNQSGQKVTREITAKTAEEAKAVLLADGCTELELKEDDVIGAALARLSLLGAIFNYF